MREMRALQWKRSGATANGASAPSPPSSGGEGWGEGVYPRVVCLWKHPSPRPSPRKSGERERRHRLVGSSMLSPVILIPAILNGLMTGAVYALVALGLTLIYGVLHIINFAHGALLTAAMFAAFFAHRWLGLDPYVAAFLITPLFFVLGYALQRFVIGPAAHGEDRNILLVTLGLAVVIENALLFAFRADTRTLDLPYGFDTIAIGPAFLAVPRVIAFVAVIAVTLALWLVMRFTDTGRAIRAVAKEKLGAE